MDEYLTAMAISLLPALGNVIGALLAERYGGSHRALHFALHAASGIILAVVAVELMPQALQAKPPWVVAVAFVAGGIFFVLIDAAVGVVRHRFGASAASAGPWLIYLGVGVEHFTDGVMIGAGTAVALSLGFLLGLAQLPADVPEGFATFAAFKSQGMRFLPRLWLALSFTLVILLGTTIGYWGVRGQPVEVKYAVLAFSAGILTTVLTEEIVPEAHEEGEARVSALFFIGGFALFALLSAYFG